MSQQNSYFLDVEVTNKTPDERQKIRAEHMSRVGFRNYGTGYENGKIFYTFWYRGVKKIE